MSVLEEKVEEKEVDEQKGEGAGWSPCRSGQSASGGSSHQGDICVLNP
jgi:hypothetical protein